MTKTRKGKLLVTAAFGLLLLALVFPGLAAANVPLAVNNEIVPAPELQLMNGVSMIPADNYIRLVGADLEWSSANNFTITENGMTMNLALGNKDAKLGDRSISLPVPPTKIDGKVCIPLRVVSNAFGFTVEWNEEQHQAGLTRQETRDGLTVADLLIKSNAASEAYNTCSLEGLFTINVAVTEDGKPVAETPLNITSQITGQTQEKPLQAYTKQTISPPGDEIPAMTMESYMTEEKMYIRPNGEDWIVQDLPFSPEFWREQQEIQSDPLKATAQMQEMGILLNFGNDVTIDNTGYYVVNATLDPEKFIEGYQKLLGSAMIGLPPADPTNPADFQKQFMEVLKQAKVDYNYTVLINKQTQISDIVKFDARIAMSIKDAEVVDIDLGIKGDMKITNLGAPFKAPDVKNARAIDVE